MKLLKALILTAMLVACPTQVTFAKSSRPQCKATTQNDTRCKLKAQENSVYCHVHKKVSSDNRCNATTQKGTRCTREAKSRGYCTQHYKMYLEGKL